jgi:hypothetical protein
MARSTTANGAGASKMATECGREYSVIAIWDSGKTARHMAMEFISGKMAIGTKDPGKIVLSTAKDLIYLPMVMCTQEAIMEASLMAKECTNGKMEAFTLENSETE